jgi:hypothetical protein
MTVIIGNASQVTSDIISAGIVSVNYSYQPEVNRMWQLGSFSAYDIETTTNISLSITNYGGASTAIALSPSTGCVDSTAQMTVSIVPAACVSGTATITDEVFFINSYSYQKDYKGVGQESWSLIAKPILQGYTGTTYMLQGIATGEHLIGADIVSNDGIVLIGSDGISANDGSGYDVSMSASEMSIGELGVKEFGVITQIGNGIYREDGRRGNASANIPHQPIYL